MGRPLKARYFVKGGAKDTSYAVKYEGVTIAVSNTGSHYSQAATIVISAPDATNIGVNATASITIAAPGGGGGITGATIINPGAGYSSNPTVSIIKPATVNFAGATSGVNTRNTFTVSTTAGLSVGMLISGAATGISGYITAINGNIISSTQNNNGSWSSATNLVFSDAGTGAVFTTGLTHLETDVGTIAATAWIPAANGGTSAAAVAILKQHGARSYLVENNQNGLSTGSARGVVKLTTSTIVAGTMQIVAKDSNGNSYTVQKLTGKKASLWRKTQNGGSAWIFANDSVAGWVLGWGNATSTTVGIQSN